MFIGKILAVVGMHRSGTSVVTGMLEEQGVFLGEVNVRNRFNPKGNRENQQIVNLHNEILRSNRASWRRPPSAAPRFTAEQRRRRDVLLNQYDRWPCAFKDPRLLVLLNFWRDVDTRFIGVIRNPLSVARSLQSRNARIPAAECLSLWKKYNQCLLELHLGRPFPLVNFDARPSLADQVRSALDFYHIESGEEFRFYEERIVQNDEADGDVGVSRPEILELWETLRSRSLAP
jgi:hypothetical protein